MKETQAKAIAKIIISLITITVIVILPIWGIVNVFGPPIAEEKFCMDNYGLLSNSTSSKYWIVHHDPPFPDACCAEGGYKRYERDTGTITRFLFGKTGGYYEENCAWMDKVEYEKPGFFELLSLVRNTYKS